MKPISRDEYFMSIALREAEKAAEIGEVPVGAVIVCGDKIVARTHNTRETDKNALCHAEVKAIDLACKRLGGWRLFMCELYVTLEPCPMCAGAIINSRIKRVIFGARDEKAGAVVSREKTFSLGFNHTPEVTEGVMREECAEKLSRFFSALREKRRKR
ncbi:MAG: nucleoside deaminase [Eubacteriales bacterium]|jgi:tRNA(adenine34) deaminase|nr:nucleoside deaminase [Clostridiales bacterium]